MGSEGYRSHPQSVVHAEQSPADKQYPHAQRHSPNCQTERRNELAAVYLTHSLLHFLQVKALPHPARNSRVGSEERETVSVDHPTSRRTQTQVGLGGGKDRMAHWLYYLRLLRPVLREPCQK